MTLEEAIKELNYLNAGYLKLNWPAEAHAASLGIAALYFRQRWEQQQGHDYFLLLPGQTREPPITPNDPPNPTNKG